MRGEEAAPLRRFGDRSGLAGFVASFKALTTRRINLLRRTPGKPIWQRNYFERIVRGEQDLLAIREYIMGNPRKWSEDPENPRVRSA